LINHEEEEVGTAYSVQWLNDGLGNREIVVRVQAGTRDIVFQSVQTGSEALPGSY
jgi:hypothetical protein